MDEYNNNRETNGYNDSGYGYDGYPDGNYSDNNYIDNGYSNNYQDNNYTDNGYTYDNYSDNNYADNNYTDNSYETYDQNGYTDDNSSQNDLSYENEYADEAGETLDSIETELTEAEIEDIKRERAAKKRKRMLREKRRQERRRQAIIRCGILLVAVVLVLILIIKIFAGIGNLIKNSSHSKKTTESVSTEATTTEEPVAQIDESIVAKELPASREAALEILKTQGETDSDIKNIVENQAVYPDILLKHLAVNSELIEFALYYPAQISLPFDGDFTVETDQNEVPLFLEYDSRWGYADYGSTILGLNGDAPTCLSMAYVYLTGDGSKNPIIIGDYSMENGYLGENDITDPKLMKEGAESFGLVSTEITPDKDSMIQALDSGKVIICQMASGDFTKETCYVLIKKYRNGLFYINDPSSQARSQVGWDFKRLSTQISSMWTIEKGSGTVTTDTDNTDNTDSNADDAGTDNGTDGGTDNGDGADNGTGNDTDGDSNGAADSNDANTDNDNQ